KRIGKPDVRDAGFGEDFGLAKLGATDTYRAAPELDSRDLRRLVRLGVRPQPYACRVGGRLHPVDVSFQPGVVNEDARGAEFRDLHPDSVAAAVHDTPFGAAPAFRLRSRSSVRDPARLHSRLGGAATS